WQMMPDLPIPVRMTRPRHSFSRSTARSNRSSRRSASARIAAASVCRTLRASARSAMSARDGGLFDDGVDGNKTPEQRLEQVELQRILGVALRLRRIVVDFKEHAVDNGRDACRRQRLDVLGLARGHAVAAAWKLQAV